MLVAAGATALSLDRRVALRGAAIAVACPSRPAKAVLACVENSLRHPQVLSVLRPKLDHAAGTWADGVIKAPQSATTRYD